MNTPIADFVQSYRLSDVSRLHMPGHKGVSFLGCEALDITEICGADVLYSANGIIRESEKNASELFGTYRTLYSTEGSSLAIRAMLAQIKKTSGGKCRILAARNAHRVFVFGCALLDIDISWIFPPPEAHLCECEITARDIESRLTNEKDDLPNALYITSPDYLGNVANIAAIAEVCRSFSVPLIVDNAHGAYRAFLTPSEHPIALGADMCCDSAHKTLPALTGGAYLHISKNARRDLKDGIEGSLSMFASTSPSYLILQSLDLTNKYLSSGYKEKLSSCIECINTAKAELASLGYSIAGSEELKLTLRPNGYGYTGIELAEYLRSHAVELEFYDREYAVAMLTPENTAEDIRKLISALRGLKKRQPISQKQLPISPPEQVMKAREALLSPQKLVSAEKSTGMICASPVISCPPAVPIVVCGELITSQAVDLMRHYGIDEIAVVI